MPLIPPKIFVFRTSQRPWASPTAGWNALVAWVTIATVLSVVPYTVVKAVYQHGLYLPEVLGLVTLGTVLVAFARLFFTHAELAGLVVGIIALFGGLLLGTFGVGNMLYTGQDYLGYFVLGLLLIPVGLVLGYVGVRILFHFKNQMNELVMRARGSGSRNLSEQSQQEASKKPSAPEQKDKEFRETDTGKKP